MSVGLSAEVLETRMSTYDLYTSPVDRGTWDVPSTGAARFSWEYDDGRPLGVLDAAQTDLEALMRDDEDVADRIEREHAAEFAVRKAEVDAAIQNGVSGDSGFGGR